MRETVLVFCSNLKQEVTGLLKVNPTICGENIETEYSFIYCTGKTNSCEKISGDCPILKICEFDMLH